MSDTNTRWGVWNTETREWRAADGRYDFDLIDATILSQASHQYMVIPYPPPPTPPATVEGEPTRYTVRRDHAHRCDVLSPRGRSVVCCLSVWQS